MKTFLLLFFATTAALGCQDIFVRWSRVKYSHTAARVTGSYSRKDCQDACASNEHPSQTFQGYASVPCAGFNHRQGQNSLVHDCEIFDANQLEFIDNSALADDRYSFYRKICVPASKTCASHYQFNYIPDQFMDPTLAVSKTVPGISVEACLGLCLGGSEASLPFSCRSVSFNRTSSTCLLSAHSAQNMPHAFRSNNDPNFRMDYYESNCYSNSYAFTHTCTTEGFEVTVDSRYPYTGVMYGLYDYFTCRVEPKAESRFSFLFPYPEKRSICTDSISKRRGDRDYVLEVVLNTDNVEPAYYLTADDMTYQATCPVPSTSQQPSATNTNLSPPISANRISASVQFRSSPPSDVDRNSTVAVLPRIDASSESRKKEEEVIGSSGSKIQVKVSLSNETRTSTTRVMSKTSATSTISTTAESATTSTSAGLKRIHTTESVASTTLNSDVNLGFIITRPPTPPVHWNPVFETFDTVIMTSTQSPPSSTSISSSSSFEATTSTIPVTSAELTTTQKSSPSTTTATNPTSSSTEASTTTPTTPVMSTTTQESSTSTTLATSTSSESSTSTPTTRSMPTTTQETLPTRLIDRLIASGIIVLERTETNRDVDPRFTSSQAPSTTTSSSTQTFTQFSTSSVQSSVDTTDSPSTSTTRLVLGEATSAGTRLRITPPITTSIQNSTRPEAPTPNMDRFWRTSSASLPTYPPPTTSTTSTTTTTTPRIASTTSTVRPSTQKPSPTQPQTSTTSFGGSELEPILFDIFFGGQKVEAVVVGSRVILSLTPFLPIPSTHITVVGCQVEPLGDSETVLLWERESPLLLLSDSCPADNVGLVCPPERSDFGIRVRTEAFRYQSTSQIQYTCLVRVCPNGACPQPACESVDGCPAARSRRQSGFIQSSERRNAKLSSLAALFGSPSLPLFLPSVDGVPEAPPKSEEEANLRRIAGDHVVKKRFVIVNDENELAYYIRTGKVPRKPVATTPSPFVQQRPPQAGFWGFG